MITNLLVSFGIMASSFALWLNTITTEEWIFEKTQYSSVLLEGENRSSGTGFVISLDDDEQVIITNSHVCSIASDEFPFFDVYQRSEDSLKKRVVGKAQVIMHDPNHDLCAVKLPKSMSAPSLKLANEIEIDTKIFIIGYPRIPLLSLSTGYIRGYEDVETDAGVAIDKCVGSKFKIVEIPNRNKKDAQKLCILKANFVFTDALSDSGASGSPVLNERGEVVGVMSIIAIGNRPFALFVPLNNLKDFIARVKKQRK